MKAHVVVPVRVVAALAVAAFVGAAVPAFPQAPKIKHETAPITRSDSGSEMYAAYCAACHGKTGKGDGPAAPALKTGPSDLTMLATKHEGKYPSASVEQVLTGVRELSAHGSSEMPVWGPVFKKLPGDARLRVYNLTKYIETLQTK